MADVNEQDTAMLLTGTGGDDPWQGPERRHGRRRDVVVLILGVVYAVVAVSGLTGRHSWDVDGRWVVAAVLVGLGALGLTAALPGGRGSGPSAR